MVATANTAGALTANYTYDPYGIPNAWGVVGTVPRFRYTGQAALPEAKLYHYKARVYDPAFGRFLQTDPVGYKDNVNLYAYVGGDPTNGADPTGNGCPKRACNGAEADTSGSEPDGIDASFVAFIAASFAKQAQEQEASGALNVAQAAKDAANLGPGLIPISGPPPGSRPNAAGHEFGFFDAPPGATPLTASQIQKLDPQGKQHYVGSNEKDDILRTVRLILSNPENPVLFAHPYRNEAHPQTGSQLPLISSPDFYTTFDVRQVGGPRGLNRIIVNTTGSYWFYTNSHYQGFQELHVFAPGK